VTGLRPVRESDLEALHALDQLCFEPGISYSRAEIRRFLRLPTSRAIVVDRGGRLAGFAIGYRPRPRRGAILTLDVDPVHRRLGLGRELLTALVALLVDDGARDLTLEVDVGNVGAIRFYERFGFRTLATLPDYYAPGRDAFEMAMAAPELPARLRRAEDRDGDGRHPV
jgi:ribosomal-protein-alanine N-acetyltransferase